MLMWVIIFLGIAIVAGALGFSGIAKTATKFAKIIFYLFLTLSGLGFLAHLLWNL